MEFGALVLIGFVALVLWVGFIGIRNSLRAQSFVSRRPADLKSLAARLGFRYRDADPEAPALDVDKTVFRYEFGVPSMRMTGEVDGLPVEVVESVYRRGRGLHRLQLGVVVDARGRWPRFVVQPDGYASDPADLDDDMQGCAQVELEDDAFDEAYTLAEFAGDEVHRRFEPAFRAQLLALKQDGEAWTVESNGSRVLLWRLEDAVPVNDLEARIRSAVRVWRAYDAVLGA